MQFCSKEKAMIRKAMILKLKILKSLILKSMLTSVLLAAAAVAQMAPTPGPELKKLDYFAGTWSAEGTISPGPWGAGGKFSSTGTDEWMPGNFFLVGHEDFKMPADLGGDGKGVSIMGYDTEHGVYTYDSYNSQGRSEHSQGTLSGDTWTWKSSQTYGGQEIEQRMTIKTLSPTSYAMKFEISMDGTNWTTFMDVKATKGK
jgi:hypothetical protein